MKFNHKEPVSIFNNWPRNKYPIPHGSKVLFFTRDDVLTKGRVTWYHPARYRDRSYILSPGQSFYKIKVPGEKYDLLAFADRVAPATRVGKVFLHNFIARILRTRRERLLLEILNAEERLRAVTEELRRVRACEPGSYFPKG